MPVFANSNLLPLLHRRDIPLYIDAVFRSTPYSFKQCLIIMALDDETDIYAPVVFVLMENTCQ
jgi:hypothetical protein